MGSASHLFLNTETIDNLKLQSANNMQKRQIEGRSLQISGQQKIAHSRDQISPNKQMAGQVRIKARNQGTKMDFNAHNIPTQNLTSQDEVNF